MCCPATPHCHTPQAVHAVLHEVSLRVGNPFRGTIQKALPFLPSSLRVSANIAKAEKTYDVLFQVRACDAS